MHEAIDASREAVPFHQVLSASHADFERALAVVRVALEACDAYDRIILLPLTQAHEAGKATFQQVCAAEEAWAPYTTAYADAKEALVLTPAPSLEALLTKVEVACEALELGQMGNHVMQGFAHDLRRLIKGGGAA